MYPSNAQIILLKLESSYGVDAVPGSANAILCSAPEIKPLDGSSVERDFMRQYYGSSGSIRVENFATVSFETELAGSGLAGSAPAWGSILRACNFDQVLTAAPVSGTATAGTSTTITLAAGASAVDDFYTGMTLYITSGAQGGAKAKIIKYVGSTKVATIGKTLAGAIGPTSQYSIGANALYKPNSNFGIETASSSATLYFYIGNLLHVLKGARGNPSIEVSSGGIPKIKWAFTGLFVDPSEVSIPTADFTGWTPPATVSTENTTDLNVLGFTGAVYSKLSIDIGNSVKHRQLVGAENVLIGDRKAKGSISIELPSLSAKNYFSAVKNGDFGTFAVKHGQTAGNIVSFVAPKMQATELSYSDLDGVKMLDLSMSLTPVGLSGNDEIYICAE